MRYVALLIGGPGHGTFMQLSALTPEIDYPVVEDLTLMERWDDIAAGIDRPHKILKVRYFLYDDCPVKYIYEEDVE